MSLEIDRTGVYHLDVESMFDCRGVMATPAETYIASEAVSESSSAVATARRTRDYHVRRLLAVGDCTAVAVGLVVSTGLTDATAGDIDRVAWGVVTLPGWILLFKIYGLYDRDGKRVGHSTVDDIPWLFHALLLGTLLLWFFYRVAPVKEPTTAQAFVFFAATFGGVMAMRTGARALARRAASPERILFVGGGRSAALLEEKIRSHPEYRLDPIGYLESENESKEPTLKMPHLGSIDELETICAQREIDRVLLASPRLDEETVSGAIRRLNSLDIRVSLLPQVVDALGPSVEIDDVEGMTVLGMNPIVLTRSSRFLKRLVDLAIAVPTVLVVLPLMTAIAVTIPIDSRGPIFYSQERIGRGGRRFRIYKFRTMTRDAEARAEQLRQASQHDAWLLLDHDPRVTRLGRFLRRTSLDELPQLFNVISGSMSLVGPRPMPPDVDRKISGWGRRRLDLTPGITGLWQVLGRTDIPFEEMVKLDYLYVTNWSLWQDIRLLIRTLPVVLSRRGAN
jgi:exopolysaccharide biosynthesis polyprenyl glycosylphosphotransferase